MYNNILESSDESLIIHISNYVTYTYIKLTIQISNYVTFKYTDVKQCNITNYTDIKLCNIKVYRCQTI